VSRLPSPTASRSPRATLRSALSWKLWRLRWTQRRQARQERRFRLRQERAALLLNPLWEQHLLPVQQELLLQSRLLEQTRQDLLTLQQALLTREPEETQELLLEILRSLQPAPQVEISRMLGLPMQPPSSPRSAS
jgi:hypothetical protein